MKNINIIAIHFGHNATAAYLQNGQIKCCVSEERFNRIKNSTGWPELALNYIKEKYSEGVDYYVLSQKYPWGYKYLKRHQFKSIRPNKVSYAEKEQKMSRKIELCLKLAPYIYYKNIMRKMNNCIDTIQENKEVVEEMENYFTKILKVNKDKILYSDHHLAHAMSTCFFYKDLKKKTLVFTLDGEGDGLCATVNIFENNKIKTISQINKAFSLGYLYLEVTAFLGMKPNEHEFKVMGLAPYAKKEYVKKILPIFENILRLNEKDEFDSNIPMPVIKYYLRKKLLYHRFDNIAGAIQKFTENITVDWIKRWIKKTGVKNIGLAGGVFMNVKMNQKIAELNEVESVNIVPSAGDESLALGACWQGHFKYCQQNNLSKPITGIKDLYLGTEYSEKDIEAFLNENGYFKKYKITKPDNLNRKIAELLSENHVVARFADRMEFGARALGNRSILANPSSYENIRVINEMIKNRDFWMPFATTILAEDASRYLINKKNIEAPYMAITFDTTLEAQKDLIAAIHPYDKTSRPQILKKETNPDYYKIIEEFKNITGIGAVLNTSFNLHGEPNVESPKDALHTFADSGLNYLAIGPFFVYKN